MTSTYEYPGVDSVSLVRWYLGDTATDEDCVLVDPLVSDAEIIFALGQNGENAKRAAAFCARFASTKLLHDSQSVRLLDFSASSSTSPRDLSDRLLKLAERLERESVRPGIYAGGISKADKEASEADTDRAEPFFSRGMHDYRGV